MKWRMQPQLSFLLPYCIHFVNNANYSENKAAKKVTFNPLRPNNDESQTSHCNIKGVSVSEVMRFENMITHLKFYWYFSIFCPLLL